MRGFKNKMIYCVMDLPIKINSNAQNNIDYYLIWSELLFEAISKTHHLILL